MERILSTGSVGNTVRRILRGVAEWAHIPRIKGRITERKRDVNCRTKLLPKFWLIGLIFRKPVPSKGKGQALILSVQGSLDRSEFFSQTGAKVRNSLRVIARQKNLQAAFSSVFFRLLGHRTFVPVEESPLRKLPLHSHKSRLFLYLSQAYLISACQRIRTGNST